MNMEIIISISGQLITLIFAAWLGYRDGLSHKSNFTLTDKQRTHWHFQGGVIYILGCFPWFWFIGLFYIPIFFLSRTAAFDIFHNIGARRNGDFFEIGYIGDGKEFTERIMIKIFGKNGALKKLITCLTLIIILNILCN